MRKVWTDDAWDDYLWGQRHDRKMLKRINQLIKDVERDPFNGIGKPEPLRGELSGMWSRSAGRARRQATWTLQPRLASSLASSRAIFSPPPPKLCMTRQMEAVVAEAVCVGTSGMQCSLVCFGSGASACAQGQRFVADWIRKDMVPSGSGQRPAGRQATGAMCLSGTVHLPHQD